MAIWKKGKEKCKVYKMQLSIHLFSFTKEMSTLEVWMKAQHARKGRNRPYKD
jgi:hypothetical protein